MPLTYSNPRTNLLVEDWPFGRQLKTRATFTIQRHSKRGERCVRIIEDPKTGKACAPKALTYAERQRIVDGDDGKTYIACDHSRMYRHVSIMRGDMKFSEESIHENDPRFAAVLALFEVAA